MGRVYTFCRTNHDKGVTASIPRPLREEVELVLCPRNFHLYGIERDDVDHIMETFPIVKRKDEQKHGECRSKRIILEIYDAMAHAMKTGEPYQTLLDPPPAAPRVAHPPKEEQQ